MGRRMMKSLCAVAVGATAVFGVGAGAAFAGEVTGPSGSGKPTGAPFHANSICVFSGLNDDPDAPLSLDLEVAPNGPGGVSQSYGQDVKLGLRPQVFNPASPGACNPTRPGTLPGT
jgi:hypothetical protein